MELRVYALSFNSSNLAFMVGLPRVSFLMVTSWALSLASRRLRSVPRRASLEKESRFCVIVAAKAVTDESAHSRFVLTDSSIS